MNPEERTRDLYEETLPDKPGIFRRAKDFTGRFIHWKTAVPSAAAISAGGFAANMDHGWGEGLGASGRQFAFSLLLGGVLYKGAYRLTGAIKNALLSYGSAALYHVAAGTVFYTLHYITGTPDPFETSIIPAAITVPFTFITAYQARKKHRTG